MASSKVYVVTQESEYDGWVGTSVHPSREAAIASINELIDEHNEEEEEKQNHLIWPERQSDWTFDLGPYRYHFETHNLKK